MTVFGVILFGCLVWEILGDWHQRGKDYVINCQFNYVSKALFYIALIIVAGLSHLLPTGSFIVLIALPIFAIGAVLVSSKFGGVPLSPLFAVLVVFLPFMMLAQVICNLFQPTSPKSR